MEPGVELQQHDREAHGGQRRQVIAQPLAGHPQDEDGQGCRAGHDRQLRDQAGGQLRNPHRHCDRRQDDAEGDEHRLLAQHGGRKVGLPDPVGHPGDDRRSRDRVDHRQVPRPGRLGQSGRGPSGPEQRIGCRRPGRDHLVGQVRRTITFGTRNWSPGIRGRARAPGRRPYLPVLAWGRCGTVRFRGGRRPA